MSREEEWVTAGGVGPVSKYYVGSAEIQRRVVMNSTDLGSSALDLLQERHERSDARIVARSKEGGE